MNLAIPVGLSSVLSIQRRIIANGISGNHLIQTADEAGQLKVCAASLALVSLVGRYDQGKLPG
jgi:hypothetical protein